MEWTLTGKEVIFWPLSVASFEVMRADRLVATLLLLQARKRVTAADVAAELEVSVRTARRDLEALSAAGIRSSRNRGAAAAGSSSAAPAPTFPA